jgi:thioredoxin reductase (NADPH)
LKQPRIAIIGAGPAGLAAALQLRRYDMVSDLFEKNRPGGLLRNAWRIENYPGFPQGVGGETLADLMLEQARIHGARIIPEAVTGLSGGSTGYRLETSQRQADYDIVIIASGTKPKKLACLVGSPETTSFLCYDIQSLRAGKGETIGIIGGGDAAHDYALSLAEAGHCVKLFYRGPRPNCLPLLEEYVKNNRNIHSFPDRELESGVIERGTFRIRLRHKNAPEEYELNSLVVAIGRDPELGFVGEGISDRLDSFRSGDGIYFVGDVCNGLHRQAAIAAGNGMKSAMAIQTTIQGR